MAPPAPLARSLRLGADSPGRAPPAGSQHRAALPGGCPRSRHPGALSRHLALRLARGGRDERLDRGGTRLADPQVIVQCGRGMPRGQCGRQASLRMRTQVGAVLRLSFAKRVRGLSPARPPLASPVGWELPQKPGLEGRASRNSCLEILDKG